MLTRLLMVLIVIGLGVAGYFWCRERARRRKRSRRIETIARTPEGATRVLVVMYARRSANFAAKTIRHLLERSANPFRVSFAVLQEDDRHDVGSSDVAKDSAHADRIRVLRFTARGRPFGRLRAFHTALDRLFDEETFVLLCDPTLRVVQDWDLLSIRAHNYGTRTVLTQRPSAIPSFLRLDRRRGSRYAHVDADPIPFRLDSEREHIASTCVTTRFCFGPSRLLRDALSHVFERTDRAMPFEVGDLVLSGVLHGRFGARFRVPTRTIASSSDVEGDRGVRLDRSTRVRVPEAYAKFAGISPDLRTVYGRGRLGLLPDESEAILKYGSFARLEAAKTSVSSGA